MTYLDEIAARIREQVPPGLHPAGDVSALFRIYALLALVKGVDVGAADVHDAWAVWMQDRQPGHPSIRPFADLDRAVQAQDEPYAAAIRKVASAMARGRAASGPAPKP